MARVSKKAPVRSVSLKEAIFSINQTINVYTGTSFIRTGVLPIDNVFEGRGLPRGKVLEFASKEGVGKSTVFLHVAHNICERGGSVVYIDTEHAVSDSQLKGTGVSDYLGDRFYLIQTQTYSAISDILDKVISLRPTMIVIDSITALKPKVLDTLNVEEVQPGLISRLQSTFFLKYKDSICSNQIIFIVLNQMRVKLNFTTGSVEVPSGGNAMKFYADARFVFRRKQFLTRPGASEKKEDLDTYGADCIIETLKNKICKVKKVEFTILYGKGVSNVSFIVKEMTRLGFFIQSSSFFKIQTPNVTKNIQGREAANECVKENYDYFVSLLMGSPDGYSSVVERESIEEVINLNEVVEEDESIHDTFSPEAKEEEMIKADSIKEILEEGEETNET